MNQIKNVIEYILEATADCSGWVAGYPDGSMFVTWDDQRFMKTLSIMIDLVPQKLDDQQYLMEKMELLVEWLSEHHFEKMHKEIP